MSDVFISYSRKDKDFVKSLHAHLTKRNRDVWVDWQDIPLTADWWQEIERGIEATDTFVFIISPDSVASKVCTQEIDYALKHNKRLVPIVRREGFDSTQTHSALRKHNWLYFRETDDFDHAFQDLLTAVEMDLDYVHAHTRLLVKAIEWEQNQRDDSFLLRGSDLKAADQWLNQGLDKEPKPTSLHTQYILASGKAEILRQRQGKFLSMVGLVGAIALSLTAFSQYQKARQQQIQAEKGEILALSASANANLASDQDIEALIDALKIGQHLQKASSSDSEMRAIAMNTLQRVIYGVKERNRLEGHNDYVREAAFSRDSQVIATVSDDKTIKLWRRDGTLMRTLKRYAYVFGLSFNPDGQTIATAGVDRTIQLWHINGQLLRTLKGHQDFVNTVQFSPDGQLLASGSNDQTVKLWKVDGTLLHTFSGHYGLVNSVTFSPNGKLVASASDDRTVKLWKLDGRLVTTFRGHRDAVSAVDFNPKDQTLASAGDDGTIRFWRQDGTLFRTIRGHRGGTPSLQFSPDGRILASGGGYIDKTIQLWNTENGNLLKTFRGHNDFITSLNFSSDNQTLISTSGDGVAKLWYLQSPFVTNLKGYDQGVRDLKYIPNHSLLFITRSDRTLVIAKADGTVVKTLKPDAPVYDNAISPTGEALAIADADGQVSLWRIDGTLLREFPKLQIPINNLRFSKDGQTLGGLSNENRTFYLWNQEGRVIRSFTGPIDWGYPADISPDLQTLMTGANSRVNLWHQDGRLITSFKAHQGDIAYLRFSPDGKTIATTSYDKTIKLWDLEGNLLTALKGHTASVRRIVFSPDNQLLLTSGDDNTIKLWQRNGTLITTLEIDGYADATRFSPDGKTIAFVVNNIAYFWDLSNLNSMPALMARGCGLLRDYLLTHPKQILELETCQDASTLLDMGRALAKLEDTPNAARLLQKALQLNPEFKFDLEAEVQQFATFGKIERLIDEAQNLALEEKIPLAIARFTEALQLNPRLPLNPTAEAQSIAAGAKAQRLFEEGGILAWEGEIGPVVANLKESLRLNPNQAIEPDVTARELVARSLIYMASDLVWQGKIDEGMIRYRQAETLLSGKTPFYSITAFAYQCRAGSIWNRAATVMPICQRAVAANPENGEAYDSRGLARALTGNYQGAIADFQVFVEWTEDDKRKAARQQWIKVLRQGQNPITPVELQRLRDEEL